MLLWISFLFAAANLWQLYSIRKAPVFQEFFAQIVPFSGVCGHHIVAVALNFLANLR